MELNALIGQSAEFLRFEDQWMKNLPAAAAGDLFADPDRAAIVSVDVINGFCSFGPLASPRVGAIADPIAHLLGLAWGLGVRKIVLTQDTHEPDAVEFAQWPAHCVRGTAEAETVPQIKDLPFFDQIEVFPKNSIHSGLNTGLIDWIEHHPEVVTYIVVGDCTDLCTYQLAMHLRLDANSRQLSRRVVVPVDCVDTYDRPVQAALEQGGLPHPGDLIHAVFLYHMALNGVEVIKHIK
jgi:nicotinamidase-related amidase